MRILFASAVLAVALASGSAQAGQIIASTTGLAAPVSTITFDEHILAPNSVVTNQFADVGVSFSPNVFYSPQTGFPNVTGNDVGNFTFPTQPAFVNPVTLTFSSVQSNVAFAMPGDDTPYQFQALLGINLVDSFTTTVGFSTNDIYGFTNESFDSIVITQVGAGGGPDWLIDNIQLGNAAAVPEPGTLVLLGSGLLGFAMLRRRKMR